MYVAIVTRVIFIIYQIINPIYRPGNQLNKTILTSINYEMQRTTSFSLLNTFLKTNPNIPTETEKCQLSTSTFPIISLWKLWVAIATRIIIPMEQKTTTIPFPYL